MVFGLDPQGLETSPHNQRHDDHDGHDAHASRAFLGEDWRRVADSPPRMRCRRPGGRSWNQACYSVHPTTQSFMNVTDHSPKGGAPPVWPPIVSALYWCPA
jgi:hypothetical protein